MNTPELILAALGIYLLIGAAFAFPFAFALSGRLDPLAQSGSIAFKLMLLPGAVMLWPALAIMCLRAHREPGA